MLVTNFTRRALAYRKQKRDLLAQGYEEIGESGGKLWELHRGKRMGHRIVAAVIATDGKSLYVKCEPT
ncbi:hypothetical protein EOA79_02360 [Mesorhizobium sp. M1A.F.Ca.IN.020.03.2.1]|uniref:hypothetical protein n=1 Tax=Mesorhizobium sp. M1A.F.Ca.IN.020.03.2.1 TaxID=2496769 RepID=UPI000FD1DF3A|nr:hypothetical protein [Mesorhizobium sp. M1A.F.Ca.IN.020.03.2.1]RUV07952.1 hypothetical protein EOA79_02360 [Mesorhizobium sp. M1A.F.Ca.IN.020.03.2.1]